MPVLGLRGFVHSNTEFWGLQAQQIGSYHQPSSPALLGPVATSAMTHMGLKRRSWSCVGCNQPCRTSNFFPFFSFFFLPFLPSSPPAIAELTQTHAEGKGLALPSPFPNRSGTNLPKSCSDFSAHPTSLGTLGWQSPRHQE